MFGVARRIPPRDEVVTSGDWRRKGKTTGWEFYPRRRGVPKGVKVSVGKVFSGQDGSLGFETDSRGIRGWRNLGTIESYESTFNLTMRLVQRLLGSGRCDRGIEEVWNIGNIVAEMK